MEPAAMSDTAPPSCRAAIRYCPAPCAHVCGAPWALPVSAATCSISADLPEPGGPSSRMGAPRHRPGWGVQGKGGRVVK